MDHIVLKNEACDDIGDSGNKILGQEKLLDDDNNNIAADVTTEEANNNLIKEQESDVNDNVLHGVKHSSIEEVHDIVSHLVTQLHIKEELVDTLATGDVNGNVAVIQENKNIKNETEETYEAGEVKTEAQTYVYDEMQQSKHSNQNSILKPLLLTAETSDEGSNKLVLSPTLSKMSDTETPCMVCDYAERDIDAKKHRDEYLCHLIVEHGLVIADVKLIADLRDYAIYWKKRIKEKSLAEFCSKIRTNTGGKDVGASEEYFLLCDALPEDKNIRVELQLAKLKKLLLRQEFERKDETFARSCPFCTKYFPGNRIILFNHMTEDHNFNIGHPDNIVNVREFLDEIQRKLDSLQCLFCEKVFKDRVSLREHMRKKSHRRLNPKNKEYDQYYIINYLEFGKNWELLQGESEKLDSTSDDWSGWYEETQHAVCFFCSASYDSADKIYDHMKHDHSFDFITMRKEMQLSFYQQVKLINYIRREVHFRKDEAGDVAGNIMENLKTSTKWNQPQYYFSTYEDDMLLCQLEDKEGLFEPEDTFVIGEDGMDCRDIVNNSVLTDLVVGGYFDT